MCVCVCAASLVYFTLHTDTLFVCSSVSNYRDEQGMIDEKTIADGWAGVVELIELDQSKSEGRHDLSAMRQLLITLKHKQAA